MKKSAFYFFTTMQLPVIDMFYSLQGEGRNTGMAAYFIRLSGCNVGCDFCDEKRAWSVNNSPMLSISQIMDEVLKTKTKNVVITGGEPTLYDLTELTNELKANNIDTFLETSGVNDICGNFTWITLSPKKKKQPKKENLQKADELKIVIETKEDFLFADQMRLLTNPNCLYYLQPEYSNKEKTLQLIIDYIKQNPIWRLSLQTHKMINIK